MEGRHQAGVRIDLQRHRHVCVAQDPHDRPRVDFKIHQQRCAGPPRVVNRHLADTGLVTSSGSHRLRVRGSRASHTYRRTPGVDPRQPRQTSPTFALSHFWSARRSFSALATRVGSDPTAGPCSGLQQGVDSVAGAGDRAAGPEMPRPASGSRPTRPTRGVGIRMRPAGPLASLGEASPG